MTWSAALAAIPNNGRHWDTWKNIGAAIYHGLGTEGFPLFEKWSEKSPFNDPRDRRFARPGMPEKFIHAGTPRIIGQFRGNA